MMVSDEQADSREGFAKADVLDARVVLLTHYIPLYQLPVYQQLARQIRDFRVLVCTEIEPNRNFEPDWQGLEVTVQKTLTLHHRWKHDAGFNDTLYVHFPRDTRAQLKQIKPDVVLSLEMGFRSLACAWHRMLDRHSRLILCTFMSQHTEQGRGTMRAMLRRWLVKRADAFTYNGPDCIEVLNSLGAERSQLFHFPYAANPGSIYRGPLPRQDAHERKLLCVGQLSQRKGVEPLIDQLIAYATKNTNRRIAVTMAGEGPLKNELIDRCDSHSPDNLCIDFIGNVSADRMPNLMREHGALIFPTLADEWGLVVNEAMHAGMPVIGSTLAQASTTLIEADRNGWLYDPRDAFALEGSLDRFFACDETALNRMRQAARDSVAHITPEFATSGLLEACKFVMASKNKPSEPRGSDA